MHVLHVFHARAMARKLYAQNGKALAVKFFPDQAHVAGAARKAVQQQYAMFSAFQ
jgi:hypothetical protein